MRTPWAMVISTTAAITIRTIRPAIRVLSSLVGDERRGALNLHHLHARTLLHHLVLVERARAPNLTCELDLAAVAVHPLQHHSALAHERGGAGAQLRGGAQVAAHD